MRQAKKNIPWFIDWKSELASSPPVQMIALEVREIVIAFGSIQVYKKRAVVPTQKCKYVNHMSRDIYNNLWNTIICLFLHYNTAHKESTFFCVFLKMD